MRWWDDAQAPALWLARKLFLVTLIAGAAACTPPQRGFPSAPSERPEVLPESVVEALQDRRQWRRFEAVQFLRAALHARCGLDASQEQPRVAQHCLQGNDDEHVVRIVEAAVAAYRRHGDRFSFELVAELRRFDSWEVMVGALIRARSSIALRWFREVSVPTIHRSELVRRMMAAFDELKERGTTQRRQDFVGALDVIPGRDARDALIAILRDSAAGRRMRVESLLALGRRAEPEALSAILEAITEDIATVYELAEALGPFGPDVFEPLLGAWRDDCSQAVESAEEQHSTADAAQLSAHRNLSFLMIGVLAELGDPRALEPLLQCACSADEEVAFAAASALGHLGEFAVDRRALGLIQCLDPQGDGETDTDVFHRAPEILSHIESPASVPFLQEMAARGEWVAGSRFDPLRALILFGTEEELAFASEPHRGNLWQARRLLRECGDRPDCYASVALETMRDNGERSLALDASFRLKKSFAMLRRFGTASDLPPFYFALNHRDPAIGGEVRRTVERLGQGEALGVVEESNDEALAPLRRRLMLKLMFARD